MYRGFSRTSLFVALAFRASFECQTALPERRVLDLEDPEEGRADQHQRAGEDVAGELGSWRQSAPTGG